MNDTSENTGLFSFVEDGTVKNIGIESSTITGAKKVGALIGRTMRATVLNCYSKASVTGSHDVGGIIGMCNSSKVSNCYALATVHSSTDAAGGIAGSLNSSLDLDNPIQLDNVYSYSAVTGKKNVGSIAGWNENKNPDRTPTYTKNAYYYDASLGGFGNYNENYSDASETGLTKLTEEQLVDGTLLTKLNTNLLDGYKQWIEGNDRYPEFRSLELGLSGNGTEENPYIIDSVEDLETMAYAVNESSTYADAHYKMTANLDLKNSSFKGIGSEYAFTGTFDGSGHVLKNVNIDKDGAENTGVFHKTDGATIKNLGVESGMIDGGNYVGGIVGKANETTILNCFNAATVRGYQDVGGIIGISADSSILNSFNKGLIRVTYKSIGGLAGSSERTTIKNSYNIGTVYAGSYTGKLIGYTYKDTLENVYYNKEAAIRNQPIGNFTEYDGIVAKTKAELTDKAFVDTLNEHLEDGYMQWVYGEDKIARLADFEETAKLDVFMSSIENVIIEDNKVQPIVSEDGKYKAVVYGSDNKNVIDLEGHVYQPLVTKKVLLILDIIDTKTGEVIDQLDRNIEVTIDGKYSDSGVNEVPNVVPGLREWYGLEGNFVVTENTRIAVTDTKMSEMAVRIQTYMKDMLDLDLEIINGNGTSGDIVLKYAPERTADLQDEGNAITIDDQIIIESPTEIGMLYGAISIMQILYQDETHTNVPKGYVRDYPQYEMRGGMLDVARKYFSIDYIEELGKYMSWFKMNTLSLHINDNGGEYTASFVVESKKYPALNSYNGQYVWSQDDYRQLQKDLKEFGVNVITEIDTPGHAKVFAKVNSSIVNGASFNLNSYYDESLALVEDVFDEFLDGDDPVFQNAVVHIGTDESSNTKENMRRYISDLSQYMLAKDNVDKVVFWGNLSLYYGETEIDPENVITQIWDSWDFRADEALEQGFEVINSTSNMMYLVPNKTGSFGPGTYFQGYTDMAKFYDTWKGASDFDTHNLANPAVGGASKNYYGEFDVLKGNPKILGTLFCDWNDTGIGYDYDIMELLMAYIAGVSEKCWYGDTDRFETGEEFVEAFNKVGNYAAYANPRYRVDSDSKIIASYDFEEMTNGTVKDNRNDYDATVTAGTITAVNGSNVLTLDGTTSMQLPFNGVGYPYTAIFDIYLDGTQSQDAVLFSCDDCTIYLDYKDNGVSFATNKYVYSFKVDIPTDKWVEVKITSQSPTFVHASTNITVLTIDGVEYTPSNITNTRSQSRSTILGTEEMFTGIKGYVDNLSISNKYNYDPALETFKFEGEGTQESPYLIQTAQDLKMFSLFVNAGLHEDAHFKLTSDIDMNGVFYSSAGEFSGTLDGDGHKITNLTISESGSSNVGLIGYLNKGTIKNLGIEESTITGNTYVGALAGKTMNALVMNCYSSATVSGTKDVGGIIGQFNSSDMYNCYSHATVSGTKESVGGIAGSFNSSLDLTHYATIDNVYSAATVTSPKYGGIVVGWNEKSSAKTPVNMTNVYYYGNLNASGNYKGDEATLLTETQVTDGTLLNNLNNNLQDGYEPWVEDAQDYPVFRYQLYDISELEKAINKASDIDTSVYTDETVEELNKAIADGRDALISESQEEIDNAIKAINEAIEALTYKPADYSAVEAAIAAANALTKDNYVNFNAVENAINAVVEGKNITEQETVNAYAKAINDAIDQLVLKDADYTAVNEAVRAVVKLNKNLYVDFSDVEAAIDAVVEGKKITEQAEVDAMAKAINDAVAALEYKPADYSAVEDAKNKVPADLSIYTDETVAKLNEALEAVEEDKNITEQTIVDGYAGSIEAAILKLEYKDADYAAVNEAKAMIPEDLSVYTEETVKALEEAVNAVVEGKNITEQEAVNEYAKSIEEAVNNLVYKDADYSAVEDAKGKIPEDLSIYSDETVKTLEEAVNAVVEGKNITEQDEVDAYAQAILEAIVNLEYKPADYTKVDQAIAKVPADLSGYTDETVKGLKDVLALVDRNKDITKQEEVDAYAQAIENALAGLQLKPADKVTGTGDNTLVEMFTAMTMISLCGLFLLKKKREEF